MNRFYYVSDNAKYDLVAQCSLTRMGTVVVDGARMFKPDTDTYVGYWSAKHMPAEVRRALTAHATKWYRENKQKEEFERKIMNQMRRED